MVPLGCSALAASKGGPVIIHQQVCNQRCFWMISGAAGGGAVCATNGRYLANRQPDHDTGSPLCAPIDQFNPVRVGPGLRSHCCSGSEWDSGADLSGAQHSSSVSCGCNVSEWCCSLVLTS